MTHKRAPYTLKRDLLTRSAAGVLPGGLGRQEYGHARDWASSAEYPAAGGEHADGAQEVTIHCLIDVYASSCKLVYSRVWGRSRGIGEYCWYMYPFRKSYENATARQNTTGVESVTDPQVYRHSTDKTAKRQAVAGSRASGALESLRVYGHGSAADDAAGDQRERCGNGFRAGFHPAEYHDPGD